MINFKSFVLRRQIIVAERTDEEIENETMDEYRERSGYSVYKKTCANVIYQRLC